MVAGGEDDSEAAARGRLRLERPYTSSVILPLPCILGFVLGWIIWNRWLAQTATILLWALALLPASVGAALAGPIRGTSFWLPFAGLFVLSLLLTELGIRGRDRYHRYLSRRFPDRFLKPS